MIGIPVLPICARGFKKDQWIYEIAESVVKPDAAFFFDVPVDIAVKRVRSRDTEKGYIDMELQYRLRDEYLAICKANHGILISTERPIGECYAIVKSEVERELSGGEVVANDTILQDDLALDSLLMVTLLVEIEKTFGIELDEADMNPFDLTTVQDVVDMVGKYCGGNDNE